MALRKRGNPPDPAAAAGSAAPAPAAPVPARRGGKLLLAAVAAVGLLIPCAATATAAGHGSSHAATAGQLNFTEQVQTQDEWCWDATALSIAQFLGYGAGVNQNTFCDYARGLPAGYPCPDQAGQLSDAQRGWQGTGMRDVGQVTGPVSFSTVTQSIDAGSPVEVGIYWTSGGGHANVLYGYDANSQTLMYADPWPSNPRYGEMNYNSYVSNYQFRWGQSLYGES
ncbi:papain-like cysteine protease family protein [Streptomyces sp. NRRL F-5126]|uniref:papain-like cysteine protease family protein n=1 Tax=Streptomyces sp. NRRL F-5126 TaxID=1463857 RepID=UPI0004C99104|nr:papain-like cysteine protease family protein [Streptomyces sp. NRRL F-5126]